MKQGNKIDIITYAHLKWMDAPTHLGILSAHYGKGRKSFSFELNRDWIKLNTPIFLDPDIQNFQGIQYPKDKDIFGLFMDSMPDTWGRTLMKRRAVINAKINNEKPQNLYDIDFLLGVDDQSRMGAIRLKKEESGPFLDNTANYTTPPWSTIRKLQNAVKKFEENPDNDQWIELLFAPGSSLGGARPKANILDENQELWIAKFPSNSDIIDKAAWEYLAYILATKCGIIMAKCKIEKVAGKYNTFFTKRFDREINHRIHFASAMTMTGYNEEILKDEKASYLDIADFIQSNCVNIKSNLHQLWTRILFSICISNTDDHLRNHGFILSEDGWTLSPAYDINPSIDKRGLALNVNLTDNSLDIELLKSVGEYFQLSNKQMNDIINKVLKVVEDWEKTAKSIGISRNEIEQMRSAFNIPN